MFNPDNYINVIALYFKFRVVVEQTGTVPEKTLGRYDVLELEYR